MSENPKSKIANGPVQGCQIKTGTKPTQNPRSRIQNPTSKNCRLGFAFGALFGLWMVEGGPRRRACSKPICWARLARFLALGAKLVMSAWLTKGWGSRHCGMLEIRARFPTPKQRRGRISAKSRPHGGVCSSLDVDCSLPFPGPQVFRVGG